MEKPNVTPHTGSVLLDLFGPHSTDGDSQVKRSYFPQVEVDSCSWEDAKDKRLCLCKKSIEGDGGGSSSSVVIKCTCDSDSKVFSNSDLCLKAVGKSGLDLEEKVGVDCISATSENEQLLQDIQFVSPPSNEFGTSCKGDDTDLRTNICSENPNQDGALLEPHDRSDGSDSGLGSELAEELVASAQADCSIDDLCVQITRHVAEQKTSLFLNNSEVRSAAMQPQPISSPVISTDANQVSNSNTIDVKTPTSDYDTQTSELSLDDDVTNKLNSESINLGIMPNRASEHKGSSMATSVFPQELPDMGNLVSKEQSASECEVGEECGRNELRTVLRSTLKRSHSENICDEPRPKKKKSISFDSVCVYYFPRLQGFTCVPSQGGSTLGMAQEHSHIHRFSISEHALEQRRVHRQMMLQLRHDRLSQGTTPSSSSGSTGGGGGGGGVVHISSSEDSDSDEEPSDASESELDVDSYYFLQPVPTRQRRALLRAAGVHRIDSLEKDECRDIRSSREMCGCACKTYCDPDTCSCSQSGIKCQVDRVNFPCGCSRDGCANTSGRIEFNPMRVRTHFIHTLMRLELEKKQRTVEEDSSSSEQTWNCSGPSFSANSSEPNKLDQVSTVTPSETEQPTSFLTTNYGPDREDSLDLYPFSEENAGNKSAESLPYNSLRKPHPFAPTTQENFPFSQDPSVFSSAVPSGYSFNYSNPAGLNHEAQFGRPQYSGFSLFNNTLPSVCSFNYSSVYNQEFPAKPQMAAEIFENGAFKEMGGDYMNQNSNNTGDCYNFPAGDTVTSSVVSGEDAKGPVPQPVTELSPAAPETASGAGTQYTNLHTVCQLGSNKLEPFSGTLQGRYPHLTPSSSNGTGDDTPGDDTPGEACSQMQVDVFQSEDCETENGEATTGEPTAPEKADDCSDENFGEIIKKTMVETVST